MTFLLDTNVWIDAIRRSDEHVLHHMSKCRADDIRLSSVVLGELLVGAAKSRTPDATKAVRLLAQSYPPVGLGEPEAAAYAEIRAHLETTGQPIGPNDLWIAAQAHANNLVLVTANAGEFSRVPSLHIENWREL